MNCLHCGRDLAEVPGNPRKWCGEYCRKVQYKHPCSQCGEPCFGKRCEECVRIDRTNWRLLARQIRWREILRMRRAGMLNVQIADELGSTRGAINSDVFRMRKAGIAVPPTPYNPRMWMDSFGSVA